MSLAMLMPMGQAVLTSAVNGAQPRQLAPDNLSGRLAATLGQFLPACRPVPVRFGRSHPAYEQQRNFPFMMAPRRPL